MAGRRDIEAGSAYVRLWMDQTALQRGLRNLRRDLRKIGSTFTTMGKVVMSAGVAIVGTITAAAARFASFGDTLNKMALRTGISAEALSELKFVAEQSGASLETVEKGVRRMQRTIGEAGAGSGEYVDALKLIGLAYSDLASLSPENQFELIASRIAAIEDATLRSAAAQEIFGRSGAMLLPTMMTDIAALREEARKLGLTMSTDDAQAAADMTDAVNRMMKAGEAAFMKIGAAAAPVLTDLVDKISKIAVDSQEWINANRQLVVTALKVGAGVTALGGMLLGFGMACTAAASAVGGLTTALTVMAAHPAVFVVAALAAGLVALSFAADKAQTGMVRLATFQGEAINKSDRLRNADQLLMSELQKLAEKEKLTSDEMKRADEIIATLEGHYGDLGMSLDSTTGKLTGVADGYDKLTEAMSRNAKAEMQASIMEANANISLLTGELQRLEEAWMTSWGRSAAMAGVEMEIAKQQAKVDGLLARYRALQSGDTSALTRIPSGAGGVPATGGGVASDAAAFNERMLDELADQRIARIQDEQKRAEAAINKRYNAEIKKAGDLKESLDLVKQAREGALAASRAEFKEREQEERKRVRSENEQLQYEIRRMEIAAGPGTDEDKAWKQNELDRQIALRDAMESGVSAELINQLYDLKAGDLSRVPEMSGVAAGPSSTFSTAAAAAMSGGSSPQERTARGIEQMKTALDMLLGKTDDQTVVIKRGFSFGT